MSSMKENVISGIFWKFGERILAQGVSFIVSIVLARLLVPEHYGIVAMITVFINIANVFVTSGFSTALIQKKDADEGDFSTIFWCTLAVSILIYMVLFATSGTIAEFYHEPQLKPVLRVFSLKIIISAYNSVQHAYVSRHMLFKRFFFSTFFGTLLSGVVGIWMAWHGFGVWALVGQYLTNSVVDCIVLGFTVSWHPRFFFSYSSARELMKYGWKVLAANLIGAFFDQLRSLVIGKLYTSSDLAYYNKGNQIPSLLSNNITSTITTVLFPAIANESKNITKVKELLRRAMSVMAYVMIPMMVACVVVARPLLLVLLTERWEGSIIYMQLLSLSFIIGLIGNTGLQVTKAIGRSDVLLKLEFYKKPVYLILLIIGAYFGVLGIAITQVVYSLYSTIINGSTLVKLINYKAKEQLMDLSGALVLSVLMGGLISLVPLLHWSNLVTLTIQIFVGMAFYIGISKKMKMEAYIYLESYIKSRFK